ncbi:ubiquitin-conjugating enzyme E2C-binding protein [Colletotrichum tabaci]|uniref:Ubiquitin-conjugating enzyme E2C-binding protein n=1 Tax=Colletotrichum tabaci TaxID=1209068 RepID=A0AAV9TXS7_9PEZI
MPSQETPSIYAELLTNIRQLSVAVSLPAPAGNHTRGLITPDGATLQLQHAGAQISFPLPGRVQAQGAALPAPPPTSRAISWRLPLSTDDNASAPATRSLHDEPVPWTAPDLAPGSAVACRRCAAALVSEGTAQEWKDLPSENWAEMMDFWHCHKPTTDDERAADHEHLAKRGYGAGSSIAAQPGVGMVDLTSFLFRESDCAGLKFSQFPSPGAASDITSSAILARASDPPPRTLYVFCSGCAAHIGFFNVATSSVVLLKWRVSCRTTSPGAAPNSSECLAATLIATLSRSGSSKSVVVPAFQPSHQGAAAAADDDDDDAKSSPSPPALHLWILNANIAYASSRCRGAAPRPAIKLLYREIPQAEADAMLESMTSDVQEVTLPLAEIAGAAEALRASGELLPPGERVFREWNVGLLDKWVAGGV